jgi:hypothetical protein
MNPVYYYSRLDPSLTWDNAEQVAAAQATAAPEDSRFWDIAIAEETELANKE